MGFPAYGKALSRLSGTGDGACYRGRHQAVWSLMALPTSTETPRLKELQKILDGATDGAWADWPMLKDPDYTLFGKIIVLFGYIDVSIRRIVEAGGNANTLGDKW